MIATEHTVATFRLVSQFSLILSLGYLYTEMCDTTKRLPSDKVKENCETNLKYTVLCGCH